MMARRGVSRLVSRTETGQQGNDKGAAKTARQRGSKPPRLLRPAPITWQTARCEATGVGWRLVLPIPVSANRIWRNGRGRTYEAAQHKADKAQLALRFGRHGKLTGDVSVRVQWVRERKSGDVDNFAGKPLLDWLKGVLFEDDKQVAELHLSRHDDPTRAPGLYVDVWETTNVREAA